MENLHKGAKWIFRIRVYFGLIWLTVFAALFMSGNFDKVSFMHLSFWVFFIPVLITVLIAEVYSRLAYRFWKFEMTEDNIKIERGVIWKRYTTIPFARVQNVDITRGILARIMKFSSLNIQTAGYGGVQNGGAAMPAEGYIPAVSIKKAEEIRDILIKKISKKGL
jgi:uncharacterized protein